LHYNLGLASKSWGGFGKTALLLARTKYVASAGSDRSEPTLSLSASATYTSDRLHDTGSSRLP